MGGVFNPEIAGTGQSVNDLSKIGYSQQDLAQMDPKRAMLSGIMKGAAGGFGQRQQEQSGGQGGGILPPGPGAAPVDPSYFAPTQYNPIYGR